jgi:hypothetical protein
LGRSATEKKNWRRRKNYEDHKNVISFVSLSPPRYFKSKFYSAQFDATNPVCADSKLSTGRSLIQLSYALCLQGTIFQFEYTEVQRISQDVGINDVGCFDVLASQVGGGGKHVLRNGREILKYL